MRWLLPVVLAAACGSKSTSPPAEQMPAATPDQDLELRRGVEIAGRPAWRGCGPDCLAAHARACAAGAKVWRLDAADPSLPVDTVYVSSTGLGRVDVDGVRHVGIHSPVWTVCDACDGATICHPTMVAAIVVTNEHAFRDCRRERAAGPPWHGRETVVERVDCAGFLIELTRVPSLAPVRDALEAINVILVDEEAPPDRSGLMVEMVIGDQRLVFWDGVQEASCADLELPHDARNVADAEGFAVFDARWRANIDRAIAEHPIDMEDERAWRELLRATNQALCREYAR
jgi:hypothetical protein